MKSKRFGLAAVAAVWVALALLAWLQPAKEVSEAERRTLAQMPQVCAESLLSGTFMEDFENYTLDQFPLRDGFRTVKSLTHYYVLGQRDNNGIYITDGGASEMEYPLDTASVDRALEQFRQVYERYLRDGGSQVYATVVPDKNYYLAEENGYLSMDYEALFSMVRAGMPWAEYVDITDCLQAEDYYDTDTHWRQEALLPVARKLCEAMGATAPALADYTQTALERPFYGVYYGQAALPMEPDTMVLLESEALAQCRVYNFVTDSYSQVYDLTKLESKDLYDVYLSGSQSLLRIENPNGATDRELVVFRDSFGSSLVPLLVGDYAAVTLVDIRYINVQLLERYVEFEGKDVLFMYSSLALNRKLI